MCKELIGQWESNICNSSDYSMFSLVNTITWNDNIFARWQCVFRAGKMISDALSIDEVKCIALCERPTPTAQEEETSCCNY